MTDLPDLPSATARQGTPGHDQALDRMVGIRLIEMRAAGMTYDAIAKEAGYADSSGARSALLRALDRHEAEDARHLRALENVAYEADTRVLRTIIADPSQPTTTRIKAIDARTRAAARHARLNGLDAPVQVQVSSGALADLADALAEANEVVLGEVVPLRSPLPNEIEAAQDGQDDAREA